VTAEIVGALCVICDEPATEQMDPPRRTLARGVDPTDPSYGLTVVLPDVALCATHAHDVRKKSRAIGWCDDERCRTYGEVGEPSYCGVPYKKLGLSRS
jgi:hypothetical protein